MKSLYTYITLGLLVSCAGCAVCVDTRTGKVIPMRYCERAAEPVPAYAPYNQRPGPAISMPPMYSPGMTTTPFLNSDGSTTFCNTTDDGYGGPLTICQ